MTGWTTPGPEAWRAGALLAAAFAWTWPTWLDPAHHVLGRAQGEFRDHLWVSWLVQTRLLEDGALPTFFPQARFPLGLPLYPLDPLHQAAMTALSVVTGPILAFNLVSTGLLLVAGIGGARLAAAFGASAGAATLAGLLVQAGPPVLGAFVDSQTEGMGLGWALWTLAVLLRPGPWDTPRGAALGLLAAATAWSCPYQAHALLAVGVPLAAWRAWHAPRALLLAAAIALPAAGLAAWGLWTAESHEAGQLHARTTERDWPPRTTEGGEVAPAPVQASTLSPTPVHPWPAEAKYQPPSTGPRRWGGWVLPALAAVALVGGRGRPAVVLSAAYAALAWGSARDHAWTELDGARVPLPFDLWWRWFPLATYAWKPAVYAVPAWCFGVAAVATLPPRWLAAGAVLLAIEVQARGPTPFPLPAMRLEPLPAYTWLAEHAGPAVSGNPGVVEFPSRARSRAGLDGLPYDVLVGQIFHRHPLGEAFGRGENPRHQALVDALAVHVGWPIDRAPSLDAGVRSAQKAGFRYLLVHGRLLSADELAALDEGLRTHPVVARFDDGVVLRALAP